MDFFLIEDDAPGGVHPTRNEGHAGRLEYEEFDALQKAGLIEKHLDYYQDFRWGYRDVEQKLRRISETDKNIKAEIIKFKNILIPAFENHFGLVGHGD